MTGHEREAHGREAADNDNPRLVQCHYEGRDFDFGRACDELELYLYDNDEPELAEYVCAQQYPQCAFVPM